MAKFQINFMENRVNKPVHVDKNVFTQWRKYYKSVCES